MFNKYKIFTIMFHCYNIKIFQLDDFDENPLVFLEFFVFLAATASVRIFARQPAAAFCKSGSSDPTISRSN